MVRKYQSFVGRDRFRKVAVVALLLGAFLTLRVPAQTVAIAKTDVLTGNTAKPALFRMETLPIEGGAELLTIFGRLDGLPGADTKENSDVPLVSIMRDTFGDLDPENDRLRYLWMLTFTRPSSGQRLAGAVPFLYSRVGNKTSTDRVPPAVMDLGAPEKKVWERFFWTAFQRLLFDAFGTPLRLVTRSYRHNLNDYRKAQVIRALAVLSLFQNLQKETSPLTPVEMRDIQARLALDDKTLGGIVDDLKLQDFAAKQETSLLDIRGHNWELLRQYSEAEGLYFDPLTLPDGSATHALVWVSRSDLEQKRGWDFKSRFLNFSNPWTDERLRHWKGFTETRYYDSENRPVAAGTEGAHAVELIPLALYGLDYPKIPMMLVDFRDRYNPKKREMSRRVLDDVVKNALTVSSFSNLPYFFGRFVYDFVTGRRGLDINQPSRLKTYSQLKLLIGLNTTMDPELRDDIADRLEDVSLNPMENDIKAEAALARQQYQELVDYVRRPNGMPHQLALDRRQEMVPLKHGKVAQVSFQLANLMTFGAYTHREEADEVSLSRLEIARRLDHHARFLREVARSPQVEVAWNIDDVRRSLEFVSTQGATANGKTAQAIARIFRSTGDDTVRRLCVDSLFRINNETAKKELFALYRTDVKDPAIKDLTANYLRQAIREDQRISRADARAIINVVGQ